MTRSAQELAVRTMGLIPAVAHEGSSSQVGRRRRCDAGARREEDASRRIMWGSKRAESNGAAHTFEMADEKLLLSFRKANNF